MVHRKHLCRLLRISLCCLLPVMLQAQEQGLLSVPGRKENYSGKEGGPNMLNNSGLDAATLGAMRSHLLDITNIVESCPAFRAPRGFNLRVQLSADKPPSYGYFRQNALTGISWMAIHELYKGEGGKPEENPETGAGVTVWVNDLLRLLPDQFNQDCDAFSLPRFFTQQAFVIKATTTQYLELDNDRRVITNGRPLVIPYTKEQYLLFQIKSKQQQLENQQTALANTKEMKARAATAPDGHKVTAADKDNPKYDYLLAVYQTADKSIEASQGALQKTQAQLDKLGTLLKNMPPAERQQQAYISYNMNPGDKEAADKFLQLTTADEPGAQALLTPNPAYFSNTVSRTGIQLIIVVKDFDSRFVPKVYGELLGGVIDCIDYNALKNMIQH